MEQIFVERNTKKLSLLEAASLRDLPFMGRKKAAVLLCWEKETWSDMFTCAVDDRSGQVKSRLLGGAGR